jgi:hypothetical protein
MVREARTPLGTAARGAEAIVHVLGRALEGTTGVYFDQVNEARRCRRLTTWRCAVASTLSMLARVSGLTVG